MTSTGTIALTGGTGFLGSTLLDAALARGQTVRALTRREQPVREGVTWIAGDLDNAGALARMCDGCRAVIHVAGVVNAPDAAGFDAGNVAGTMKMLTATRAAGVERFIFVSSLSAREPQLSNYGASKRRAETLVQASGLDWTIVRPPAIFGPRDRELLEVFRAARAGVVPMPRAADKCGGRLSVIYAPDLALLLLELIPSDDRVFHQIFEPDDGRKNGWSHAEFARAIGVAVGRRVLVLQLPGWAMRTASRMDRALRGARAKLTMDRVAYMLHPDWVVNAAARPPTSLWTSTTPTDQALAMTASWQDCDKNP